MRFKDFVGDAILNTSDEYLSLHSHNLDDLDCLSEHVKNKDYITHIDIRNNHIKDIAPLKVFKRLTHIYASSNLISDLTPLSDLKNLKWLLLNNNPIEKAETLANFHSLSVLHLNETCLCNLNFLNEKMEISELGVGSPFLDDIIALSKLNNLKYLSISNIGKEFNKKKSNYVTLTSLEGLNELTFQISKKRKVITTYASEMLIQSENCVRQNTNLYAN